MRATTLTITALVLLPVVGLDASSVGYERRDVLGVSVHLITANLNDPRVKVSSVLATSFPGGDEPFADMARRSGAVAAVTGTFFSTSSRLPVGDIVIDGSLKHFGGFGTALAITPANETAVRRIPFGRHVDWRPYETVVSCGPGLVHDGVVAVNPRAEGFSDPRVMSRAWRVAAGVTSARKLLLVAVTRPLTLTELAKIMRRLGCVDAINLDGGSSTAMYYRGRVVTAPGRHLVHLLTVHEAVPRETRYAAAPPEEAVERHARQRKQRAFAFYEWAEELERKGDPALALSALRFAIAWDPANASYQVALGEALLAAGEARNASAAFASAGKLYVAKKRPREAVTQLSRALALSPLDVSAREALGDAYESAGFSRLAAQHRTIARMSRLKLATPSTNWRRMQEVTRQLTAPSLTLLSAIDDAHASRRKPYGFTGDVAGNVYRDDALGIELRAPPGWELVVPQGGDTLELRCLTQPGYCTLKVLPTAGKARLPELVAACHEGDFSVTLSEATGTVAGRPAYDSQRQQIITGQTVSSRSLATQEGNRVVVVSLTTQSRWSARAAFDWLASKLRIHRP